MPANFIKLHTSDDYNESHNRYDPVYLRVASIVSYTSSLYDDFEGDRKEGSVVNIGVGPRPYIRVIETTSAISRSIQAAHHDVDEDELPWEDD